MTGKWIPTLGAVLIFSSFQSASYAADAADSEVIKMQVTEPRTKENVQVLEKQHQALMQKIQLRRVELLKNNPKLRKMYLQILQQARELALELDSDRKMQELNTEAAELEKKLSRLQSEKKTESEEKSK